MARQFPYDHANSQVVREVPGGAAASGTTAFLDVFQKAVLRGVHAKLTADASGTAKTFTITHVDTAGDSTALGAIDAGTDVAEAGALVSFAPSALISLESGEEVRVTTADASLAGRVIFEVSAHPDAEATDWVAA